MQQDAHEFLNYLLNTISETLSEEKKNEKLSRANGTIKKGLAAVNPTTNQDNRPHCQPRYCFKFWNHLTIISTFFS